MSLFLLSTNQALSKLSSATTSMKSLANQILSGRWFMIFACFLIMSVAGATYMFGLYSPDIKQSLGYDQTTLNLISFFKDLGANVGILSGLINEVTPPWVVLSIGAALNFFGYFMIWLAVEGKIPKPKVWQMCVYICVGANSQSFANTGALVTGVMNFPENRGVVIGLTKGFVGLSGAIITQLYHGVYGDNTKSLILMISWLPAAISFAFLRTIRIIKVVRQANELKVFYIFLYMSMALAGFLMIIIIVEKQVQFTRSEYGASAAIVLCLLFLPVLTVMKEEFNIYKSKILRPSVETPNVKIETELVTVTQETQRPSEGETAAELVHVPAIQKQTGCFHNVFRPPERGDDYTILQALFSIDMCILFMTTICGIGGTLTAIDNLGQIGLSLGYPKRNISTFVTLVSIWNYVGRVFSGFLSEIFLQKYKFPRPLMLTMILLLSCAGHLLIAFSVPNGLYVASVIIGFCFGAQWPLIFAIVSEVFGLKYYSTLYNFSAAASPLGSYILNVRVAGHLYDMEARRQMLATGVVRGEGEDLDCKGGECFKLAFIIITLVTIFGALVSIILVLRTKNFYKSDIYKKFREEGTAADSELMEKNDRPAGEETIPHKSHS